MKQAVDRLWVVLLLAAMLLSLGKAIVRPKDINYYENRPAAALPAFTVSGLLSGEDQDALEQALSDQTVGAQGLEQRWHRWTTAIQKWGLRAFMRPFQGRYVSFQGMEIFDDYIVYPTRWLETEQDALEKKAEGVNALIAAHPELTFYAYFIEKDTDLYLETDYSTGVSDYLLDRLDIPSERKAAFPVRTAEDFKRFFFRTDHHWNYAGADRAYRQLMPLLGKAASLQAEGPERIAGGMSGSKALLSAAEGMFTEDFYAYRYAFPPMEITINGKPAADFGAQNETFADGEVSYSAFYGGDDGEICFHTENPGAGSLLVIGESFDNALLKLLASEYENLYSIDLRNYETDIGHPFDLASYTAEHHIDSVLLIGNLDYWKMEEFLPGGGAA